jgi:hypothetical protein
MKPESVKRVEIVHVVKPTRKVYCGDQKPLPRCCMFTAHGRVCIECGARDVHVGWTSDDAPPGVEEKGPTSIAGLYR